MSNTISRQRGFFDPISLGFLLAILGTASVVNTEAAKEAPEVTNTQASAQIQITTQPAAAFSRRLAAIDLE